MLKLCYHFTRNTIYYLLLHIWYQHFWNTHEKRHRKRSIWKITTFYHKLLITGAFCKKTAFTTVIPVKNWPEYMNKWKNKYFYRNQENSKSKILKFLKFRETYSKISNTEFKNEPIVQPMYLLHTKKRWMMCLFLTFNSYYL